MTVWARYETATRRLRHWSTTPFTVAPGGDETDVEVGDQGLPGPANRCRLTVNLNSVEIDPGLVPPTPPDPDEVLATTIAAATTLQELKDALLGNMASSRVKGRPV